MHYAFQDTYNLYMILDLVTGGDLRHYLSKKKGKVKRLTETETKFITACTIQGIQYLHEKGIMHRDIKPENLIIDSDGYIRITDLGISRLISKDTFQDEEPVTSGTPGYMRNYILKK